MKGCKNRCYLRGTSWLGLLNTILGCSINRVLIKVTDSDTGEHLEWRWGRASDHPQAVL